MTDALLFLLPCVFLQAAPSSLLYLLTRAAPVYHLGLFREKVTLQPVECMEVSQRSIQVTKMNPFFESRLLEASAVSTNRHGLLA